MNNNYVIKSLLVASLAVLSACGGDDAPVSGTPTCQGASCGTTLPAPVPTNSQTDYISSSLIPMMQQQYGSVTFFYSVNLMGRTIPAGTHTWATVYSNIVAAINSSGCQIQNQAYSAPGALGNLNYGCLQSKAQQYISQWNSSYVQFEYQRYSNSFVTVFELVNWFLSTGSSYHQNYYYPQYGQQYNPYQYQQYQYQPYWGQSQQWWNNNGCSYAYGQYQNPYYTTGSGAYVRIYFAI